MKKFLIIEKVYLFYFAMSTNSPPRKPPKEIHKELINEPFERFATEEALNSEEYQNALDYRSQCHALYNLLHENGFSNHKLASLLGVDHKSFEKQLKLPIDPNPNGRPVILNEEEKNILFSEINGYLANDIKPTLYDLIQVVIEKFKKTISPDTLSRYIIESGQFRIIKGEPMDLNRYEVDDEEMKQYFVDLKNTVDGVPASLVFNMDEAGQDDYIDTHSIQVVVKSTCQDKIIQIPLRRESKRATLIHCISADGTYAKPLLIVPRKTLDRVLLQRLTCNNCIVKYQCHGFANTMIIRQWLEKIFFPLIKQKWEIEHQRSQYNGNVILIIDGMSAHAKALQFYNLVQYHLQVIYLVPHSSHLSQPLDLVLFSIQKLFTTRRKLELDQMLQLKKQ